MTKKGPQSKVNRATLSTETIANHKEYIMPNKKYDQQRGMIATRVLWSQRCHKSLEKIGYVRLGTRLDRITTQVSCQFCSLRLP